MANRKSNPSVLSLALVVVCSLSGERALAQSTMFAMGRTPGSNDSTLLEVTPSPFSVVPIGTTSLARLSGIDFQPGTNTLFAVSGGSDGLYTLDTSTGAATLVGTLGILDDDAISTDLAFDNDGTAFTTDFVSLYSIDLTTGVATIIGSLLNNDHIESIAVDPMTNILYGLDYDDAELWSIDKATGAATSLGVFGALTRALTGFGIDSSGTFYASTGGGNGEIWRLDPSTLTKALVGDAFAGSVSDIAFRRLDPDADGDGLSDNDEINIYGTDPNNDDTDNDGLLDGTEVDIAAGTGCPDPLVPDSDGDTISDGDEVASGTNPCAFDTDGDGLSDLIDPVPLIPDTTGGAVENGTRVLAELIDALPLPLIDAKNNNAAAGRQNSMSSRMRTVANELAQGSNQSACALLTAVLGKIDGQGQDWMIDSPQKSALASSIVSLLGILM